EVVADLVDQDVGDDLVEADVAALAPFVEDRAAVEEDAAGLRRGAEGVAQADVDAVIEAGQFEGILDPHLVQDSVVSEVVDADDDIAGEGAERIRQVVEGLARQAGEVVEGRGGLVGPFHRDEGLGKRDEVEKGPSPAERNLSSVIPSPSSLIGYGYRIRARELIGANGGS